MVLLLVLGVQAADSWSDPHPGVRLLERTTSEPWHIVALSVDLCAAGVSLRATRSEERKRSPSSFMDLVGAEAAINGDFFDYGGYDPTGLAVGEGEVWHDDNTTLGFVAFGDGRAEISDPTELVSDPESWIEQAVGGYPLLVRDGVALSSFSPAPSHCDDRHPRTAVGLSEDHGTLQLIVVDGRSSASAGMTCRELAVLAEELGAHSALNLDGGGSSAMVVAGLGAVNVPSDGAERTVSNHLAVHATGSGTPGSCHAVEGGIAQHAAHLDRARPADLDGDGRADLCGRGQQGLWCHPSAGGDFESGWLIEELSDEVGWRDPLNHATLRFGDVTGDGLADACARADAGVRCWPSTGSGFDSALAGPELSDDASWDTPEFATTLRLADIDGDGLDDVCAKGWSAWRCWPSTGTGFGDTVEGPTWVQGEGWEQVSWYGAIRTGDVDGDGLDDVCGRDSGGMVCALSEGAGFGAQFEGPAWSDGLGWDRESQWSTIRLADVDGDSMADLCGRSSAGFVCHMSEGTAFGAEVLGPDLSDDAGWGDLDNATTIRLGDLDADGDLDVCARANVGIWCWPWTGEGFGERLDGPALGEDVGWGEPELYGTLRMGDVDGDGREDLCARSVEGVECWLSEGSGFIEEVEGPEWSDAAGWDDEEYWSTIRLTGVTPVAADTPGYSGVGDTGPEGEWGRVLIPEGGCGCSGAPGPGLGVWLLALLVATHRRARHDQLPRTSSTRSGGSERDGRVWLDHGARLVGSVTRSPGVSGCRYERWQALRAANLRTSRACGGGVPPTLLVVATGHPLVSLGR